MIVVARGVTLDFARSVVRQAVARGARANVKPKGGILSEIWVRDIPSDRDIVHEIIMAYWHGGLGAPTPGVDQANTAPD